MLLDGWLVSFRGPLVSICSLALASWMDATVPSSSVHTGAGSLNLGPQGCLNDKSFIDRDISPASKSLLMLQE